MKILVPVLFTLLFGSTAAVVADSWRDGNPDLYEGGQNQNTIPLAVQPGIGDSYGGSFYDGTGLQGFIQSTNHPERKVNYYGVAAVENPDFQ